MWIRSRSWIGLGLLALGCSAKEQEPPPPSPSPPPHAAPAPLVAQAKRVSDPGRMPEVVRIPASVQDAIDDLVSAAIARGDFPGAVVVLGRRDGIIFRRAYGALALEPVREAATEDAIYDLASLTKPIATATSIALLVDDGRLHWDDRAASSLPELAGSEHAEVTLRELLTHTAGFAPISALSGYAHGLRPALAAIARTRARAQPGERVIYSDLGFVLLGAIVERVSGKGLDAFAAERLFTPLAMRDTGFRPLTRGTPSARIAPTELRDGLWLRGSVHDQRAAALGGVAGHAGLFSSADDLARFARMMLGKGELEGVRVLSTRSVAELTRAVRAGEDRRALGWDVANGAHPGNFGSGAFGHGGFTGTSLWIDPDLDLFAIVLSNRLHPDGKGAVQPTAERVEALAAEAVRRHMIARARSAPVVTGIDVLVRDGFEPLRGTHVGLVTNRAARARDGRTSAELFAHARGVQLIALFSPEHGLEVAPDEGVEHAIDPRTGARVFSLYGGSMRPSREALAGIDTLVFDLQDVGARFYTYLSTLHQCLIAAGERRLRFVVLDRPNPLGGAVVEGPSIDADRRSFVNHHAVPIRHGLTAGEMARLLASELGLSVSPEVIAVEGWDRRWNFPDTGLAWVAPSPNLPSYESALLYPGIALLETTNISVGRGTEAPFERVGAPFVDARALVRALKERDLPGVEFSSDQFVPTSSTHAHRICHGVRIHVTDRERVRPVSIGLAIAAELVRLDRTDFEPERMDVLLAQRATLAALLAGRGPERLESAFEPELAAFRKRRAPFLLY